MTSLCIALVPGNAKIEFAINATLENQRNQVHQRIDLEDDLLSTKYTLALRRLVAATDM